MLDSHKTRLKIVVYFTVAERLFDNASENRFANLPLRAGGQQARPYELSDESANSAAVMVFGLVIF